MRPALSARCRTFPLLLLLLAACGASGGDDPEPAPIGTVQEGIASWYGPGYDGTLTASGEVYDQNSLTAAHDSLPFGTLLLVTNLENGRQVQVRVNNRGPNYEGRILDLSYGAGGVLEMVEAGLARVRIEVVGHDRSARSDFAGGGPASA